MTNHPGTYMALLCLALAGIGGTYMLTHDFQAKQPEKVLRIAIVDTGYNRTKYATGLNFCNGRRVGLYENDDVVGHGTIITSLIFNNVRGKKQKVCFIMEHLSNGGPVSTAGTITEAINRAIDQHPDVLNLSLIEEQYTAGMYKAIKRANDLGIVIFTAAGNSNLDFNVSCNKYPACFRGLSNLHTVGAYNEKAMSLPSKYSNYGVLVTLWYSGEGFLGSYGTSYSTARATADWVNNYSAPVEQTTFFKHW